MLMMKPAWPRPVCPNPDSGSEHQFAAYLPAAVFVCDGCGDTIHFEEAGAIQKWWLYVTYFSTSIFETANKWN